MIQKPPKKKKCKICREVFQPSRMIQPVCDNYECKLAYAIQHANKSKANAARAERKKTREARQRIKPLKKYLDDARDAVNAYVRARDAHLGCISCDKPANWNGQWHASHFRSVGAASSIRFNLWNIHKSCSVCNHYKSGNLGEYTPRLRAKIGDEKVDWLYTQNAPVTYSIEYLQRLKKVFTKKTKHILSRRKASNFGG